METQPALGITNPYSLDETQFAAAVDAAQASRRPRRQVLEHCAKQIDSFTNGNMTLGTGWQYHRTASSRPQIDVASHQARRGRDRLVGHLDDQLEDEEPELRLHFLNHITSAPVNAQIVDLTSARRRSTRRHAPSRELHRKRLTATTFHAGDGPYWENIYYWTTPTVDVSRRQD